MTFKQFGNISIVSLDYTRTIYILYIIYMNYCIVMCINNTFLSTYMCANSAWTSSFINRIQYCVCFIKMWLKLLTFFVCSILVLLKILLKIRYSAYSQVCNFFILYELSPRDRQQEETHYYLIWKHAFFGRIIYVINLSISKRSSLRNMWRMSNAYNGENSLCQEGIYKNSCNNTILIKLSIRTSKYTQLFGANKDLFSCINKVRKVPENLANRLCWFGKRMY